MIYLDYAASSPPFPEVISLVSSLSADTYGNPGALHSAGAKSRQILQQSRFSLARQLQVRPEELFFTSGGTESNNWAVKIGCSVPGKTHIACFAAEHSSVLEPVRRMQQAGYRVSFLPPDSSGYLHPESVEDALQPDTALLCVQAVNNETGVIQNVDALSDIARRHRVTFFCDAVQGFAQASQALHKADLISLSAHKLGGPRGVGCLVVRQPLNPAPLLLGGGQEFGARSGTENIPAIAGFSLAAEKSCLRENAVQRLQQLLEQGLSALDPRIEIAGHSVSRTAISAVRFPGISGEEMVMRLDQRGICTSLGAACAARSTAPSHVFLSMGYTPREAAEFVRFSLGRNTTEAEIQCTVAAVADIIQKRSQPHGK